MDPVEEYLSGRVVIGERRWVLRDLAMVSVLRDIRDLLAIIAGGVQGPEEKPPESEEVEIYIEDGRLKRRARR